MAAETSILKTIKKLLGMDAAYTAFDEDILVHINTVLSNLHQIGVGPEAGYVITGDSETWALYFPEVTELAVSQQIKSYIYMKVRLMFDPPSNGNLLNALKESASELEVRLYTLKGGY